MVEWLPGLRTGQKITVWKILVLRQMSAEPNPDTLFLSLREINSLWPENIQDFPWLLPPPAWACLNLSGITVSFPPKHTFVLDNMKSNENILTCKAEFLFFMGSFLEISSFPSNS
jgi:hypothetical protein